MAHSRHKLLGICRETLRRWFDGVDFDSLPEAWRISIMARAEQASRDHEQPKFAVEECYRGLMVERLDAAEEQQGPHR